MDFPPDKTLAAALASAGANKVTFLYLLLPGIFPKLSKLSRNYRDLDRSIGLWLWAY